MEKSYSNSSTTKTTNRYGEVSYWICSFVLIVIWCYAVFAKLSDLRLYQNQMEQQPFSHGVKTLLTYLVPFLELAAAVLLIANKSKLGLWVSFSLLFAFTIYIILILTHFFPSTPCSCGGFISKMSWEKHLYFNGILICFNMFCLYWFIKKKGG
ncbi:MauE/DoxX family redox-associated membrane protein [Pedobacter jamesrossensis]|uniref:MauE/DoxX family redox-associated membrane protein n=1 Tax=Pedobacter jamesrossensis TaxID=1908238 RepID=A0ABV8NPU3_9SPHI